MALLRSALIVLFSFHTFVPTAVSLLIPRQDSDLDTGFLKQKSISKYSCEEVFDTPGSAAWDLANGTAALDTFTNIWQNDLLFCSACFNMTKDQCKSDSSACIGLRTASTVRNGGNPRWDLALGMFTGFAKDIVCGAHGHGCDSIGCSDVKDSPAGYVLMSSMVQLSNYLNSAWQSLDDARRSVSDQADAFGKTFAPLPDYSKDRITIGVLTSAMAGILGVLPAIGQVPLGAVSAGLGGVAGSAANNAFANSQNTMPADISSILGHFADQLSISTIYASQNLFTKGEVTVGDTTHSLASMMAGGKLLDIPNPPNWSADLFRAYSKIIYQQLAANAWQNLQKDGKKHTVFITFAPGKCEHLDYKDVHSVPFINGNSGLETMDNGITYNDTCYWLVDAVPRGPTSDEITQGKSYGCRDIKAPPGGTHKELSEGNFGGLSLEDFIIPSVEGWLLNKKENGFSIRGDWGVTPDPNYPTDLNITVCDYIAQTKDSNNLPGTGCPILHQTLPSDHNVCNTQAPNAHPNPPSVYQPGSCKIHFQQFTEFSQMPDRWKDPATNPYNYQYQLSVSVTDDANRPIGNSAKEWVGAVLKIWNTALPFDIFLHVEDKLDEPIEVWYSDTYFTTFDKSPEHNCKMGAWDDWHNRQIDCAFPCPAFIEGQQPPPSATIGHLLPTGAVIQSAIPSGNPVANGYTVTKPTDAPAYKPGNYSPGKCWLHVTQYQRNNPVANPFPDYAFEAYLGQSKDDKDYGTRIDKDSRPFAENENGQIPAAPDVAVPIYGLRDAMTITFGDNDKEPLVTYAGKAWYTNIRECNWPKGKEYKDGRRDFYCVFDCV